MPQSAWGCPSEKQQVCVLATCLLAPCKVKTTTFKLACKLAQPQAKSSAAIQHMRLMPSQQLSACHGLLVKILPVTVCVCVLVEHSHSHGTVEGLPISEEGDAEKA